jgi:hypothetical protein
MDSIIVEKLIDRVKAITADAVAKKQDEAKENFPNLIKKITDAAGVGNSEIRIIESCINQFDKKLLEAEGFYVSLVDRIRRPYDDIAGIGQGIRGVVSNKEWLIKW